MRSRECGLAVALSCALATIGVGCGGGGGGGSGFISVTAVTAVSPTTGPSNGGTNVTITGSGFVPGATVLFGSAPATSVQFVSANQLTATTPAGSGTVNVSVVQNGLTSTIPNAFAYGTPLAITSVSPGTGAVLAPGTVVTITGTGFAAGAIVAFGGVNATNVTVVSSTQITATVPIGGTATAVNVTVTQNGVTVTLPNGFTYAPAPARLSFTTQPPAVVGTNTTFAVTVRVEDANGNVSTIGSPTVALALGNNPGMATLGGTTTGTAAAGLVTFNVSINRPGTGFTLVASSNNLANGVSMAFNVTETVPLGGGRFWVTTTANTLLSYDLTNPNEPRSGVPLGANQLGAVTIEAIDFRPADGRLYGIGSNKHIYRIDTGTGAVTTVTPSAIAFVGSAGFDFNPAADRIRVVGSAGENFRVHPDTGSIIVDGAINPTFGPGSPDLHGAGYTNSHAGATATTLYVIDATSDTLYLQNPPNAGTIASVGSLGVNATSVSFDIAGVSTGVALLTVGGNAGVYNVSLTTGATTLVGVLANAAGTAPLGFALEPPAIFALTDANQILSFSAARPGTLVASVTITGLLGGDVLRGIDFRPATGELYGLGVSGRLYKVNPQTGGAVPVGSGLVPVPTGTEMGFDFNPTVDRIRIVTDAGQNLRADPVTGLVSAIDSDINPGGSKLIAAGYTNSFPTAGSTALFVIDSVAGNDRLRLQNPPNNGTLVDVGSLGIDVLDAAGFDIDVIGNGYAALRVNGTSQHGLYTVNLQTGGVSFVGTLATTSPIRAIAIPTPRPTRILGLTATSNLLVSFNPAAPTTAQSTVAVTGLAMNELLLAIEFRPANGQLYGLGSTSRLYRIDPVTGVATIVTTTSFSPVLNGTAFDIDFNPTVDRIRLTSNNQQNLRLHPDTGLTVAIDGTLLYAMGDPNVALTPVVAGSAYQNPFLLASTTTLFNIDARNGLTNAILVTQNPPNNGTLNTVGSLGVPTDPNFTGFDIAPNGVAFASITTVGATTSQLYTINLGTGAATLVGTIGGPDKLRDVTFVR